MKLTLTIPCIPLSGNRLVGKYRSTSERKKWFKLIHREAFDDNTSMLKCNWFYLSIGGANWFSLIPKKAKMKLVVTEYRQTLLDRTNLETSIKPIEDALQPYKMVGKKRYVGIGLIWNDNEEWLDREVSQIKVAHRAEQKTVIQLEELT